MKRWNPNQTKGYQRETKKVKLRRYDPFVAIRLVCDHQPQLNTMQIESL